MFFFVVGGCIVDFFTVDVVCILYDAYFFLGDFTDDTDSKSRAREWLTEYQSFRNSKFKASFTDLIFEQITKRLNDFFEINEIRKASYIVVGFDHCGFSAETALYNVRINGSLCKEIYSTDLLGFFLEDTDKFLTDDLTLRFRLCNTGKLVVISLLCVHADKVQVKLTIRSEYTFNLITFILTKKAMIYKYTGKLLADRSGKKSCCHGGIYTT